MEVSCTFIGFGSCVQQTGNNGVSLCSVDAPPPHFPSTDRPPIFSLSLRRRGAWRKAEEDCVQV